MRSMTTKPGILQRLRWSLTDRPGHAAVGRLDRLQQWLEYQQVESWRRDAEALARFAAAGSGEEARRHVADLEDELTALRSGLPRGYDLASAERWDQLRIDLDHLEERRRRFETARGRLMELTQGHLDAQQAVQQELADCNTCLRAEVLSEELAKAPELEGLAKPDLSAYREALAGVEALVPADGESHGRISFSPEAARVALAELRQRAADAEQAASGYFYEALRGYEAVLGEAETRRLSELLKDPIAMRRLRQDHPEMFDRQTAYGMGDMMPMMLMFWLLSSHSPGWEPPPAEAAGAAGTPMHEWLAGYEVPEVADFVAEWESESAFDAAGDWGGGGDSDDGGGFDSGGGDFGGGGDI